jgi:hypothetical protein
MKADSPEMRALLPVLRAWDPLVFLDLHVTDGAHFLPDVSLLVAPLIEGPPRCRPWPASSRQEIHAELRAGGHLPLDFYPSLVREDDRVGLHPHRLSAALLPYLLGAPESPGGAGGDPQLEGLPHASHHDA